jgi:hypothetical protein
MLPRNPKASAAKLVVLRQVILTAVFSPVSSLKIQPRMPSELKLSSKNGSLMSGG